MANWIKVPLTPALSRASSPWRACHLGCPHRQADADGRGSPGVPAATAFSLSVGHHTLSPAKSACGFGHDKRQARLGELAGRGWPQSGRVRGSYNIALAFFLLAMSLFVTAAHAELKFPPLTGRVVDDAHLLTPADKAAIEADLKALEGKSSDQLVVYTAKSLQGYTIEDYGYQLGRAWGIGQKGTNNGVILIVAPAERKVRIEVGRGLEPQLTDLLSGLDHTEQNPARVPARQLSSRHKGRRSRYQGRAAWRCGGGETARRGAAVSGAQRPELGRADSAFLHPRHFHLCILGAVAARARVFPAIRLWRSDLLPRRLGRRRRYRGGGGGDGGGFSGGGGGDFGGGGASGDW